MALTTTYLTSTKKLESFLNAIITAQAPETFTQRFLENLEFKSTSDRLFITLLKALGMLDESAKPTERYFRYLDQSESKKVLAEGIREAYEDLFSINVNAYTLPQDEVKNKLRTLTQGKKTEDVVSKMAATFTTLSSLADWSTTESKMTQLPLDPKLSKEELTETRPLREEVKTKKDAVGSINMQGLHYNIQIHLPESRDPAVYDAIFRSIKEHLV